MEKHTNPPLTEESEENLLDQLEDRLADIPEGEDPFAAVQPILDELDRRNGPAEFDPAQGWADLLDRQKPKKRRWVSLKKYPLAAVIVLLCLVTACAALSTLGLPEKLVDYFNITRENSHWVAGAVDTPDCTLTEDNIAISIKQTIADSAVVYVVYEVIVPDDITLPENAKFDLAWITPTFAPTEGYQGGVGHNEILEYGPHRILGVAGSYGNSTAIQKGPIRLMCKDLGYYTDESTFVPLLEGCWRLEWDLNFDDTNNIFLAPNQPVQIYETKTTLKELSLSPLSLNLIVTGHDLRTKITIFFQDGTSLTLDDTNSDVQMGGSAAKKDGSLYQYEFYYRLYHPIDPSQVTTIRLGNLDIPVR